MRKELEVVGGVKSLLHCRCQTVHSIPSHPATTAIYMSMDPTCWLGMFHFHRGPLWLLCHLSSLLCHPTFPFPSSVWSNLAVWFRREQGLLGRRQGKGGGAEGWRRRKRGGVRHIEFAKSGRTIDRKPGRKEDETLPMKCHCLCDVTWSSQKVTGGGGGGLLRCSDPLLRVAQNTGKMQKRRAVFSFQTVEYKLWVQC